MGQRALIHHHVTHPKTDPSKPRPMACCENYSRASRLEPGGVLPSFLPAPSFATDTGDHVVEF